VARLRKAALAAVALSALALTSTAASAQALTGSTSEGSEESSMSWAYYSGELTDFTTTPEVFKGAKATAVMVAVGNSSYFRVNVRGISDSEGVKYGAHLHKDGCVSGDGSAAGPHYNITPTIPGPVPGTTTFEVISNKTEVWLDFRVNSEGNARTTANVPFAPKPGERSIVFHGSPTQEEAETGKPVGWAGTRLACVPLKIKSYAR
jgi:Cu/Zn superoxide dismutase